MSNSELLGKILYRLYRIVFLYIQLLAGKAVVLFWLPIRKVLKQLAKAI